MPTRSMIVEHAIFRMIMPTERVDCGVYMTCAPFRGLSEDIFTTPVVVPALVARSDPAIGWDSIVEGIQ